MKSFFLTILAASLSLSLSHALAEAPECLNPVTDSDAAIVQAYNQYFLKKETYFARQYRIVKVNTDLLLNADQIKISLFDDLSATLQVSSVDVHPDGLSISWTGRFIEPSVSIDDLLASGVSRKEAEVVLPHLNSLSISAGRISFDEKARLKYPFYFPRFEKFRNSSRKFSPDGKSAVYDVVFLIQGIVLPEIYELRPLASDPQHHVLIQLDPNKVFTIPIERPDPNAVDSYAETPENGAKRQQYRDFLNSLGPDPRPSDISKE